MVLNLLYEIFDETGSNYNLSKARAIHYPRFFLICNAHVSTLISKKQEDKIS